MGARLIRDLNPAGSSSPESIISIDGLLFFTADLGSGSTTEAPTGEDTPDPDNDSSEDGNENNREGSNNSNFNDNTTGDTDQAIGQGPALMKSDGTSEGTKVLKEFQSINNLVEVNGELYFIADDGTGNRLWRSDGTARGTVLVKDLYPGADPNFPQDLFEIDGVLFYAAIDGTGDDGKYPYVNGYEVWRREGDGVGSRFFRNLIPDKIITDTEISSEEIEKIALDENGIPIELIKTTTVETTIGLDGITTITTTVEDENYINGEIVTSTTTSTSQKSTEPNDLNTTSETVEYTVYEEYSQDGRILLYRVNLKKKITVQVTVDLETGLKTTTTTVEEDQVYKIDDERTIETVISTSYEEEHLSGGDLEGTTFSEEKRFATTIEVINTAEITTNVFENDSFPQGFIGINGNYFFTAQSSTFYSLETRTAETLIGGLELWFSDGTEAGTYPININQNDYTFYEPEDGEYTPAEIVADPGFGFVRQSSSSFPRELTKFGNQLVLVANDGNSGFELWAVSAEGDNVRQIFNLAKGNTSTSPEQLTVVGDRLYFTANVGSGRKLYSITSAQPLEGQAPDIVKGDGDDPKDLTAIEDKLYFSAKSELGRELWVADGNSANLVEDINQGTGSSSPSNFTAIKNQRKGNIETLLFFTADGGEHGVELWSLDLANNSSKPQRYDDIVDGPTSSEPRQLFNAEQRLYFTAGDGVFGR